MIQKKLIIFKNIILSFLILLLFKKLSNLRFLYFPHKARNHAKFQLKLRHQTMVPQSLYISLFFSVNYANSYKFLE